MDEDIDDISIEEGDHENEEDNEEGTGDVLASGWCIDRRKEVDIAVGRKRSRSREDDEENESESEYECNIQFESTKDLSSDAEYNIRGTLSLASKYHLIFLSIIHSYFHIYIYVYTIMTTN